MKTRPLIISSLFLMGTISAIVYYVYQILSELVLLKELFIVIAFFTLWAILPLFFRSVNTIIREAKYRYAQFKNRKK